MFCNLHKGSSLDVRNWTMGTWKSIY